MIKKTKLGLKTKKWVKKNDPTLKIAFDVKKTNQGKKSILFEIFIITTPFFCASFNDASIYSANVALPPFLFRSVNVSSSAFIRASCPFLLSASLICVLCFRQTRKESH
jgi:hypothetical protein